MTGSTPADKTEKLMKELEDFQIIQRNAEGYAMIPFGGGLEKAPDEGERIMARVVREDDNLTVVYWTPCECDGKSWSATLRVPEGGLYRFEACVQRYDPYWANKVKCVYHVGVGDIYVTAGQSNMTGYGRDSAYDPPSLGVHALANNGSWGIAVHPLADSVDSMFGYPEGATGTSPALSFARNLRNRLGVPVGIIPTAVGGTSLSQWDPEGDGGCYREMLRRLELVGDFKGFVWFQGCSDANGSDAPTYFTRFARMCGLWRQALGGHPILTVQLNRWMGTKTNENDKWWGMIRDAQRRAALELPGVYVVPSLDLPVTDGIHNGSGANVIIGERLANTALGEIYGKPGQIAPSILGAKAVDSTHIRVSVTPGHHISVMDNRAMGMNVEDAGGLIECDTASGDDGGMTVSTEREFTLPAKFHYAWRSQPPVFVVRDYYDMPLLACYGIDIE